MELQSTTKFGVIYADPPWAFKTHSTLGMGRSAEAWYECMDLESIKALPVENLAARDCVLLMWVTDPFLRKGFEVLDAWGFEYKTVGFYWIKTPSSWFGTGYWTRANPEQCRDAGSEKLKSWSGRMENPITLLGRPLPIFPCFMDKRPMTPHGFKDATTDFNKFITMKKQKECLVGVPTGEVSGFDVLDIDPDGLDWYKTLPINLTREHITPRGGSHLLFMHNSDLRNSASKITKGVDVRADGGYIIWWPEAGLRVLNPDLLSNWPKNIISEIRRPKIKIKTVVTPRTPVNLGSWLSEKDCNNLLSYSYEDQEVVDEIYMELLTGALGVTMAGFYTVRKFSREYKYATQAAAQAMLRVGYTVTGERNDVLNAEAYALGRIMARRWRHPKKLILALLRGAQMSNLVTDDGAESVIRTIISGLKAGLENPYPDLGDRE